MGFDWVWFLSVWQTGPAAQAISRANPEWRKEFQDTLPDLKEEDIGGSGFAIQNYIVHRDLGGDAALARLRQRLQKRGLKLMLDFVPNHMAPDHPWIDEHPDYFVHGSESDLVRAPRNYCRVQTKNGSLVLAYGRDPYFEGWPDTLQLNYGNPQLQQAMIGELERIAGQCDGVRCDMAMLLLPDVFESTWGIGAELFWPKATGVRAAQTSELPVHGRGLLGSGMDAAATGIRLRLRQTAIRSPARRSCAAGARAFSRGTGLSEQARSLSGKPRRAAGGGNVLLWTCMKAAAVITFLSPGLRFFHQGQFEGRKKRISPHLVRGPEEPVDKELKQFYDRLLSVLRNPVVRNGDWQLLECVPAWDGNWTSDCFVAFAWQSTDAERLLVVVNYAPNQSQCHVRLPFADLGNSQWRLADLLSEAHYDWNGNDLEARGLFVDMAPWQAQVFSLNKVHGG